MTTKLSLFADNRASPESRSYAFGATSSNNRQVLIVGAGPTGLVAAIEVARRGVPCRIIDRLPMRSQNEIEGAKWLRQSRCKRAPRMLRDDGHRRRCLHRLGTTDKGRKH